MIVLGGVIGARFANTSLRLFAGYLAAAFGAFAVAVTIAAIFAAVLIKMLVLPVPEVMIAYAPGSADAMMQLALALHLDPVYVGAHHVMRVIFVSLAMPLVARRPARSSGRVSRRRFKIDFAASWLNSSRHSCSCPSCDCLFARQIGRNAVLRNRRD